MRIAVVSIMVGCDWGGSEELWAANSTEVLLMAMAIVAGGLGIATAYVKYGPSKHPVFGRSDDRESWTWVMQRVRAGAFTEAFLVGAPEVREAALKAGETVLAEIAATS